MKHTFTLPEFPDSTFAIEVSFFIGKIRLFQNDIEIIQSKEKGKPFYITHKDNTMTAITPKRPAFGTSYPRLEVNGTIHNIAKQMKWYGNLIIFLPIIFVMLGGLLGGLFGGIAIVINSYIMSRDIKPAYKYILVAGVSTVALVLYLIILAIIIYTSQQPEVIM